MSDDPQADRLHELEERVARLEALLHVRPPRTAPVAPQPAVAPPPPVAAAAASPPSVAAAAAAVEPPPLPGVRAAAAAEPPPPPGVAGRADRPREPAKKDLESFVGLAVLGRVGAAALLLAAAYFGQLGWTRLGPSARVAVVYAGSALLIALGFVLRSRVQPRFTALLWGAGTALSYLAGTLAALHYELVPPLPALALLLGSAAVGQWLGRTLRLEALATVALAGAYAAPVLVGTPSPTPTRFFALLVLLHTWAAWTQARWNWHLARGLAVVCTAVLVAGWYAANGRVSTLSLLVHLEAVLVCVSAPEILAAFRARLSATRGALALAAWAVVQFVLLWVTFVHGERSAFGPISGAVLLAAAARLAVRTPGQAAGVARLGGLLLAFGVLVVWSDSGLEDEALRTAVVGSLGAASLVLLGLRRWTIAGELASSVAAVLGAVVVLADVLVHSSGEVQRALVAPVLAAATALVCWGRRPAPVAGVALGCAVALFGLCRTFEWTGPEAHWLPIALAASVAFAVFGVWKGAVRRDDMLSAVAVALLASVGACWLYHAVAAMPAAEPAASLPLIWNLRLGSVAVLLVAVLAAARSVPADARAARAVLAVTALVLGFAGGLLEVITFAGELEPGWSRVATSLYTLLFAGALLAAGFARSSAALRWAGLAGFAAVALKVTLFDLANVDTPLRVLATGAVGAVLLLAAYAYGRTRRRGAAEPEPSAEPEPPA